MPIRYLASTAVTGDLEIRSVEPGPGPGIIPETDLYSSDFWQALLSRSTPVGKCPVDGLLYVKPDLGRPVESFNCPDHNVPLEIPYIPPEPPIAQRGGLVSGLLDGEATDGGGFLI